MLQTTTSTATAGHVRDHSISDSSFSSFDYSDSHNDSSSLGFLNWNNVLAGRSDEQQVLRNAVTSICNNDASTRSVNDTNSRFVVLYAPSGTGKTALISDLREALATTIDQGRMAWGQGTCQDPESTITTGSSTANRPYAPIVEATTSLARQLLKRKNREVLRQSLKREFASSADQQLLINVIPALQPLFAAAPEPTTKEDNCHRVSLPVETVVTTTGHDNPMMPTNGHAPLWTHRFGVLYKRFLHALIESVDAADVQEQAREVDEANDLTIAQPQQLQPIVLVLEHLQWADDCTLQFLRSLVMDRLLHHCLILGTVQTRQSCSSWKELLKHEPSTPLLVPGKSIVPVERVVVPALALKQVQQLLTQVLHLEETAPSTTRLSNLVHTQTGGNPLHLKELVEYWKRRSWVILTPGEATVVKLEEIEASPEGDLFKHKLLSVLNPEAQTVIVTASFLGAAFQAVTLQRLLSSVVLVKQFPSTFGTADEVALATAHSVGGGSSLGGSMEDLDDIEHDDDEGDDSSGTFSFKGNSCNSEELSLTSPASVMASTSGGMLPKSRRSLTERVNGSSSSGALIRGNTCTYNVKAALRQACRAGILTKFRGSGKTFSFVHERIQAAAMALLPKAVAEPIKCQIGHTLIRLFKESQPPNNGDPNKSPTKSTEENAQLLYAGATLLQTNGKTSTDPQKLGTVGLRAAQQAALHQEYQRAIAFVDTSLDILLGLKRQHKADSKKDPKEKIARRWSKYHELSLSLANLSAEMHAAAGDTETAQERIELILQNTADVRDRFRSSKVMFGLWASQGDWKRVVEQARIDLKEMGCKILENPKKINVVMSLAKAKKTLWGRGPKDLENLTYMDTEKNKETIHIQFLLSFYAYAAWHMGDNDTNMVLCLQVFEMSIKHGISEYTPQAMAAYGLTMAYVGNMKLAADYARLGEKLCHGKAQYREALAKTSLICETFLHYLDNPIRDAIDGLRICFEIGMQTSSIRYAAHALKNRANMILYVGMHMADAER